MSTLSQGPFDYNRFSHLDDIYRAEREYYERKLQEKKSGAKPDYLDFDGDGNKDEPMKKALKEKGKKKTVSEGEMPDFIKKKMKEKHDDAHKDDDKKSKSEKKDCKEEVTLEEQIIEYLMENGFANNPVSAEVVMNNASYDWLNHIANDLQG